MKVLYIAHYKEASGWGEVARNNILALDSAGVEVVPRPIILGNAIHNTPNKILELEENSCSNCDIVIQHVLPHYMKYDSRLHNIGIVELETANFKLTSWVKHLNLMDEIWVPCQNLIADCVQSGVTTKIECVPHAFNYQKYNHVERLDIPTKNAFTFYFVGEMIKRKHLSALIQAFHTEFRPYEPVELILKVNKYGMTPDNLAQEMEHFCNQIKQGLRLYNDLSRYKPEIVITNYMPEQELLGLHKACDCFVLPSYGEAWNIPAWEAMAMGNLVIASATGAMLDYIDSERNGFLVPGKMEPIFAMPREDVLFDEFGRANERWFNISTQKLMETMRRVYKMDNTKKAQVQTEAKLTASRYDYPIIGAKMKELLINV